MSRAELSEEVELAVVQPDEIGRFFEFHLDVEREHRRVYGTGKLSQRANFDAKWRSYASDERILVRTIRSRGEATGYIVSFFRGDDEEVGYWLGREFWGRGLATEALRQFLMIQANRPLVARVADDNLASTRVLAKCGFERTGRDEYFSESRGRKIGETLFGLQLRDEDPVRPD